MDSFTAHDTTNGTTSGTKTRYGKPLPPSWIPLCQKPLGTPTRRLRIVTIGGAVAGMGFAYKLQHEHKLTTGGCEGREDPLVEHTIYEANADIGGTWLVNKYPGVACDVPAHLYAFPFEPNPTWSSYYASGAEVLAYFKRTVAKYNLDRDVKLNHRVERAEFNEAEGKWHLRVRRVDTDEMVDDTCDVLVSATGFLSHWRWPSIPGLDEFQGHLAHSADWQSQGEFDYTGKRIGIIGNGSSAIQILPRLAPGAAHLVNFVRRPTWITAGLGSAAIDGAANYTYTEAEKREFADDPGRLKQYRKRLQQATNTGFNLYVKGSEAQEEAFRTTAQAMRDRLGGDEELARKLIPDWEVGCRRATPGPGYLEALTRENVSLVTDSIESVTASGICTHDGRVFDLDAIVCATGFDVSHRPPWPLIGRKGFSLAEHWKEEPYSYLSLMASGFPNFFMFGGPNSPVGHGSLMSQLQWSAEWICKWVKKIAYEDIKLIDPKPEVLEEFNSYADEIMQTLVWSGGCRSWYKNHRVDGRVTAVWAGSAITYHEMIKELRPEDFDIVYRSRNRFKFMGNGRAAMESTPGADLAFYIYK
ncbi:hypothetical protein N8I77_010873 [Diaporthe amygdali]|uniref:Uncharacterized protein n=1 Tax=Phomopsis amygdali TaxID=1214568 RepID=A0AAD9W2A1_PHOAM|nr:hypothetical protein N8I77_010873 [Diaporthe amygdali]